MRLHGFGLATPAPCEGQPSSALLVTGSLPFLAPEQTGRTPWPVDARSDLYALGLILYALWSGQHPLHGSDAPSWIHAHLVQQPAPLESQREGTPSALAAIVSRLLAKTPDDRYQTALGLSGLAAQLGARSSAGDLLSAPIHDASEAEQIAERAVELLSSQPQPALLPLALAAAAQPRSANEQFVATRAFKRAPTVG